jgi:geranylgeranyl diphosphate synthase, type II
MIRPKLETTTIALVNETIDSFFEQSIAQATSIDPSYRQLWKNLHHLIQAGGKRLRPQMTLLAYEAFGGTDNTVVVPVAAAQELLHFCLLIHDDVIDRDYVRHGTPNIAGQYKTSYARFIPDETERNHYANSAAILGGDLMLSGAYQLIASSALTSEDKLTAQALLARSIFDVAGGELLDTEASFVPYLTGNAFKIAEYKTASYSFIAPLLTGATLAGASENQLTILRSFALSLGIAFQLVDDILGVFGVEETTGKSTSSDIREGKRTYMIEQAVTAMSDQDTAVFEHTFGNPTASAEQIESIRALLMSTGARRKNDEAIALYAKKARDILQLLSFDEKYMTQFEQLIHRVTDRSF